jgi:hypothetical protein
MTRRRLPLSCEPCRERQILGLRNASGVNGPCLTCARRGIPSTKCIYLRDVYQRSRKSPGPDNATNIELLERVNEIEGLLESRYEGQSRPQTTAASLMPKETRSHVPSPETNLSSDPATSEGLVFEGHGSLTTDVDPSRPSTRSCGTLLQAIRPVIISVVTGDFRGPSSEPGVQFPIR